MFCAGVDHIFDDGLGLLHIACISQNLAAVQCLVAAGIDPNYCDTQGQSTLHAASFLLLFCNISSGLFYAVHLSLSL